MHHFWWECQRGGQLRIEMPLLLLYWRSSVRVEMVPGLVWAKGSVREHPLPLRDEFSEGSGCHERSSSIPEWAKTIVHKKSYKLAKPCIIYKDTDLTNN